LLIVGGLAASMMVAPESAPETAAAPRQVCPDGQERAFLRRLNGYRNRHGKKPLVIDAGLMRAAHRHSVAMTGMSDVRNHNLPGGVSWRENVARHGYPVGQATVGENLAFGTDWNSGAEVFRTWRGSRSHNSKLTRGEFRALGIARVYDPNSRYGWYWTAIFGTIVDVEPKC
jgi:uncharacterized protein YkwD